MTDVWGRVRGLLAARRWMLLSAVATLAVAGACALLQAAPAPAQGAAVSVYPIPGSQVASPQTQITFRGVPPSQLGPVTVTGSTSGPHTGRMLPDSDGLGASFVPDVPFSPGETVTVATGLNIVSAASPNGSGSGTYSFAVAQPTRGFPTLHWPPAGRVPNDVQGFRSRPDLAPVSISVNQRGAYHSGDIFLAPQWGPLQDGPMILDPQGNLIWFDHLSGDDSAADFRVQRYHGQPVLTWWEGHLDAGVGIGEGIIFDSSYREIAIVQAGNGLSADLHEFTLTPRGTAIMVSEYPVYFDASSVHGSKHQIVLDSVVQEIDISTGLVLFQWDSLDHVPLSYTYQRLPHSAGAPFDPDHINSVDVDYDGNLLISMRNTWAMYKVNKATGAIMWTLGGRRSSFKLAPGTFWAFQHDARVRARGDRYLTLFDDDAGPPTIHRQSRAIRLQLDFKHMTARQVNDHAHVPGLSSNFEGNFQQLVNGDDFIGWGQQPYFSEYDRHGRQVFDARMEDANSSYRVYRFAWSAVPWTVPAVATARRPTYDAVWVSWNGATNVAGWRVYGGSSPSSLRYLMSARKISFETGIEAPLEPYIQVQALDAGHHVIKSSNVVAVH